ncbi:thyroid peroxidase-like protein precursor [Saccoglossus kowalevskii]|uniref:Thyroid peroxidase-like protein n=1 Tax=Saccoglossus kowalevskii TaxID=10224 RepID=D1LXG3_SACKO|nr:thyroid peroxidase-like protein precursor [Saccoglossus kowalevskii]ACY92669.1 thyroid peroxidase-like protein [Saccoglossus kowalevskii]
MKHIAVVAILLFMVWFPYDVVSQYGTNDDDEDNAIEESAVFELCFREAVNGVDRAIFETSNAIRNMHKPITPAQLLKLFRYPTLRIIDASRNKEVFEILLDILRSNNRGHKINPAFIETLMVRLGCRPPSVSCNDMCFHSKFRTIDGTCNNFKYPSQGAALTPFTRMRDSIYENGFTEPVGWNPGMLYNGFPKPLPRDVTNRLGRTYTISHSLHLTDLVSLFGQFLDHDTDLTPQSPSSVSFKDGQPCSASCDNKPPCFPLLVPDDDPRIHGVNCTEFIRSSAVCGTGSVWLSREQTNAITSYIDASQVYGSEQNKADNLRAFDGKGGMRVGHNETATGRPLLPFDPNSPMACLSDDNMNDVPCFLAGDTRANELTGLTSMHTLFLREHNRISNILSQINPHWDDEQLYQEARKIVGATLQHITYDHYLPKIIGDVGMESMGVYNGYDPDTNAAIANVFATAAFRFGHATVKPFISRLDENFNETSEGHLPLHRAFFQPWRIVEEGGIDPVIRGFFATAAKDLNPGEIMTDELTEHLFELSNSIALDLMSLNIQRGRDHALPGYTVWRDMCGLVAADTFDKLKNEMSDDYVRHTLQDLYGHPGNIDLFIGALAEDPLEGSVVGPTFNCILARQFNKTRNGDRFWYENDGYFSENQVAEIKKTSLARIICDNTNIDVLQQDVFLMPSVSGGFVNCHSIEGFDLNAWTHQQDEDHTAPSIKCPSDIVINAHAPTATVYWPRLIVRDNSKENIGVTCSRANGSDFPEGVTIVTCTCTDSSGNCATCSFSVVVQCNQP